MTSEPDFPWVKERKKMKNDVNLGMRAVAFVGCPVIAGPWHSFAPTDLQKWGLTEPGIAVGVGRGDGTFERRDLPATATAEDIERALAINH